MTRNDERALAELCGSLLRRRCPEVHDGDEAFDQHLLLAVMLHRVARLHMSGKTDTEGWISYVTSFFPPERNGEREAFDLWGKWRCTLLKDEQPLIPVTHGQPHGHFRRDIHGRLYLNLENLWADYEYSVERFIEHLREHGDRRKVVLERWRKRAWRVEEVTFAENESADIAASTASVATAITGLFRPKPDTD